MATQGDRVRDRPLADVGGKGLFVKELERAIADGRADIAVHSMKDVPAELPPRCASLQCCTRANPLDAFVSVRHGRSPRCRPARASAPRARGARRSCTRRAPISLVSSLRGNVDTRLARLEEGALDAILLACAGLERLGLADADHRGPGRRDVRPAVGQGVIGIECARTIRRAAPPSLRCTIRRPHCGWRPSAPMRSACTAAVIRRSPRMRRSTATSCALRGFVGSPDGREATAIA